MSDILAVSSYIELLDATRGAEPGDTIQLSNDIELAGRLTFANSCKVDLSNYVITVPDGFGFNVIKGTSLKIENGDIISNSDKVITLVGTEARPCELVIGKDATVSGSSDVINIQKQSKCIIDGGKIIGTGTVVNCGGKNSTIDVRSGKIICTGNANAVVVSDGGRFVLDRDGHVDMTKESWDGPLEFEAVYISGSRANGFITGDCHITSEDATALTIRDGAEFSIEDGLIESDSQYAAITVSGDNSKLHIIGGKIANTSGDLIIMSSTTQYNKNYLDIVGGELQCPSNIIVISEDNIGENTVSISGGRYYGTLDTKYLPEGKIIVDGEIVDDSEYEPPHDDPDPIDPPPIDPDPEYIDPDDGEDPLDPSVDVEIYSVVFRKPVTIYMLPGDTLRVQPHLGAVDVFSSGEITYKGVEFVKVRVRVRGCGGYSYGYIEKRRVMDTAEEGINWDRI